VFCNIYYYSYYSYFKRDNDTTKGIERRPNQTQQNGTRDNSKAHQERYSKQEARANNTLHNISHRVQHRPTGRHKLGYMVVHGHIQPRTEMGPTRPSKHAYTATMKLEVGPAQP
jgi:hypothetical protein